MLFESASGYGLFSVLEAEEVGSLLDEVRLPTKALTHHNISQYVLPQVQQAVTDLSRFQRTVKLVAFQPFMTAEHALENMNAITEHALTDDLKVNKKRNTQCVMIGLF